MVGERDVGVVCEGYLLSSVRTTQEEIARRVGHEAMRGIVTGDVPASVM